MKKIMGTLAAVLLVLSVFTACGEKKTPSAGATSNKTITLAMVSAWDSLIPFDTTSSYSDAVLDVIFDKLVYLKQNGSYEPRLATSWEMSSDNTELTVHLNKNAKWHDGKPVTADDVVFTCKLYGSPTVAAPRQNNVSPFVGFKKSDDSLKIEAVDSHTVKFVCPEPTNMDFLFFIKFRDIYILPKHLLGNVPLAQIREQSYWKSPIGSGPGIYDSQISGERIEFKANKNYHLKSPDWDRFIIRVVKTPSLLSGLMNNEIDIIAGNVASLQLSDWDLAKQQSKLQSVSTWTVAYQYMTINTSRKYLPPKVRQAISLAVNREAIVKGLLKGEGEPAYGPFGKKHKYYNEIINIGFNPEKAKKLLAEAGWDGSRELVFSVPTGNTIREQASVIIQQNLLDIGIKTKIESADFPTHLNRVRKGDYDLGLIGSGGSPDPSECVINFKPDHINNFSQLDDWTIYNTGAEGEHAFNFEDRRVSYDKYQKLLVEQVPFCFLYFQNNLFAYNKRIGNVKDNEDFAQLNRDIWNWTVLE